MEGRAKVPNKPIQEDLTVFSPEFDFESSIKRYGQIYPIIKSEYGIVDGVHRSALGCEDERVIEVESELDHWILRYQLNEPAKAKDDYFKTKRECIGNLARLLKEENPSIGNVELEEKIGELLGVSKRTVRKYLPEEYKRKYKIGSTLPISKQRERIKQTLGSMDASQYPYLKEILRNTKPYLHGKKIQEYFTSCSLAHKQKRGDFFTVFIEDFYLKEEKKIKVSNRLLKALEIIHGETDPEYLVEVALTEYIREHGVTDEQIIKETEEDLKEEWLIGNDA